MATAYGSWVATDDFRAKLVYTVSGTTVTATLSIQSSAGYASTGSGTVTIKKGSTSLASNSGSNKSFSPGSTVQVATTSKAITKTTSAQTITVTGTVGAGYTSGKSTATATITIPALATYAIKYSANGHGTAPAAQTKTEGVNITLRGAMSVTGYTFGGWNTNSSGTGTNYAAGSTYSTDAALNLYAKWTANTYTVSYSANGGSGAPSNQNKTYGTALTLSSTKPTRTGYTFAHWNTKANDTGTSYASGGTMGANAITANTTLYAIWTANTFSITYNANGGTGEPDSQTKVYGEPLTLRNTVPTRTGYAFVHWNTENDNTGYSYGPGATYNQNVANTMYAIWRSEGPSLTIQNAWRSLNDGTASDEGTYITVSAKWSMSTSGSILITASTNGQSTTVTNSGKSGTETITINANASVNSAYTVTVAATANSQTTTVTYKVGSTAYPIDVHPNGNVAIGKVAGTNYTFDVEGSARIATPLARSFGGTGASDYGTIVTTDIDSGVNVATSSYKSIGSVSVTEGTWLLLYTAQFPSNSTGRRYAFVSTATDDVSADHRRASDTNCNAVSGGDTFLHGSIILVANASATWNLNVWQNSGSTLACLGYLRAFKLR